MTDENREAIGIARRVVASHVQACIPDRSKPLVIYQCSMCQRCGTYEGTIYDFKHEQDCDVLLATAALDQIEKELQ